MSISLVQRFERGDRIIDVGTGGGLPGLPMAILNPEAQLTLLDSNGKKMQIVEDIALSLGLRNVRVVKKRAEEFQEKFDFMLGRAVSAVPSFLGFSSHFLDGNSQNKKSGLLYIKGGEFSEELQSAEISSYNISPINKLTSLDTDKTVLYIPASEIVAFNNRKLNAALIMRNSDKQGGEKQI
jgi:16S rRNA (guanine527-N7)-methyltransferase